MTGKSQSIRITGSTRLPEDTKKRMVEEAERYSEQDRKRRQEADQLNDADSLCYQADKTIADFGSRLSGDLRGKIEAAIRETREAHGKRDAPLATQRAEALKKLLQEAGSALYAQAAPGQGPSTPETGPAQPPQEKVVDAEFRETR